MKKVLVLHVEQGKDLLELSIPAAPNEAHTMPAAEFIAKSEELKKAQRVVPEMVGTFLALPDIVQALNEMSMTVFVLPDGSSLLTSDNPVVVRRGTTGIPGIGAWMAVDAFASIPISPSHLLFVYKPGVLPESAEFSVYDTTAAMARVANFDTLTYAHKEVYSSHPYAEAQRWMRGIGVWEPKARPIRVLPRL